MLDSAWTVGAWHVDARTGELRQGSEIQRLEPKVLEVLIYLAGRAGQVVSRDELLAAVWPRVVVGDDALTQAIIKLRKALGDEPRRPTYIETLAKRGYRLIATVAPVARESERQVVVTVPAVAPEPLVQTAVAPVEVAAVPPAEIQPPIASPAELPIGETASPPAEAASSPAAPPMELKPWRKVAFGAVGAIGAVLAVLVVAAGVRWLWPAGNDGKSNAGGDTLPVIAVLPLSNQSGDAAREFFSDGVTDDIIHALGRYSGVRVISRNSVQQFKQRDATPQMVRDKLGARYVVTGSVREAGGQVRVAVELSDAQTARVLWSERFDRKGGEVFQIQDSIVQNIVGALAVKVSKLESERAATRPPSQREAYDLVLLARAHLAKADRAANRQGRALVAQARELAPDYAMAYVVESELEDQRNALGWIEDPARGLMLTERAARQALTFNDPGANARAHAQLGRIHAFRGEYQLALAESERARALNPSDTFIAEVHADTLLWAGKSQEAIELMESALRLDPAGRRSPIRQAIVIAYFAAARYPEGLAACDRALAEYPELPMLHGMRAAILAQTNRLDEARESAAKVRQLQPNFPVADFGNRFADAAVRDRFQAALRKAGL